MSIPVLHTTTMARESKIFKYDTTMIKKQADNSFPLSSLNLVVHPLQFQDHKSQRG